MTGVIQMKIQCLFNKLESVEKNQLRHLNDFIHDDEVNLIVGKKYDVFGIAFREGYAWFYVLEDDNPTSLRPHFSGFFKILDATLPIGWQYCDAGHSECGVAFLPGKWAETSSFYEKLINEDERVLVILNDIRRELVL